MSEPMKNPPARKTQTAKRNYQKENGKVLDAANQDSRVPTLFLPQLLYAVQQLRAGISVAVFFDCVLLQSEYFHKKEEGI